MGSDLLFMSVLVLIIASPNEDADKALAKAYFRESGLNRQVKQFEKNEVPDEARVYLGYAAYISKTVADKKIVFTWRFL